MKIQYWGVFVLCNCLLLASFYWCGRWEVPLIRELVTQGAGHIYEMKQQQRELSRQMGETQEAVGKIQTHARKIERLFREIRSQQIRIRRGQLRPQPLTRQGESNPEPQKQGKPNPQTRHPA